MSGRPRRRWPVPRWTGRRTGVPIRSGWPQAWQRARVLVLDSTRRRAGAGPHRGVAAGAGAGRDAVERRPRGRVDPDVPGRRAGRGAGLRGGRPAAGDAGHPGGATCARSATCSTTGTPGSSPPRSRWSTGTCGTATRRHRAPDRGRRGRLVAGRPGRRADLAAYRPGDDRPGARRGGRPGRSLPARQQRHLAAHPGRSGVSPASPATSSRASRRRPPCCARSARRSASGSSASCTRAARHGRSPAR